MESLYKVSAEVRSVGDESMHELHVESTLSVLHKGKQGSRQYSCHWDMIEKFLDAYVGTALRSLPVFIRPLILRPFYPVMKNPHHFLSSSPCAIISCHIKLASVSVSAIQPCLSSATPSHMPPNYPNATPSI